MPDTFQKTNDASELYIPYKYFVCRTVEAFRDATSNIPKTNGVCLLAKSIDEITQDHTLRVRRTWDLRIWLLITRENGDPTRIELPFYRIYDCIRFVFAHAPDSPPTRISYADIQSLVELAVETEDYESKIKTKRSIFEALKQLIESVWEEEEQRLTPNTRIRSLSY